MIELLTPYRGYKIGELTGDRDGLRYETRFSSGMTAYFYSDEFTKVN